MELFDWMPPLTEGEWGLVLGVAGIVIGLAVALWQSRQAKRERASLEARLVEQEGSIAHQVGEVVVAALGGTSAGDPATHGVRDVLVGEPGVDEHRFAGTVISLDDINGDGRDEVLIQYAQAAHSSMLAVLGWKDQEFGTIGTLWSNAAYGFAVGDLDETAVSRLRRSRLTRSTAPTTHSPSGTRCSTAGPRGSSERSRAARSPDPRTTGIRIPSGSGARSARPWPTSCGDAGVPSWDGSVTAALAVAGSVVPGSRARRPTAPSRHGSLDEASQQ